MHTQIDRDFCDKLAALGAARHRIGNRIAEVVTFVGCVAAIIALGAVLA